MTEYYGYVYQTYCTVTDTYYVGHRKWARCNDVLKGEDADFYRPYFPPEWCGIIFPLDLGYLGSGKDLLNAVRLYGKKAFQITVLELAESREDLIQKEEKWITRLADSGQKMYNISRLGNMGFDPENNPDKVDYLRDLSDRAVKNNYASYFGDCRGENNGRFGKPVTEATRNKISQANRGRVQSEAERKRRSEIALRLGRRPPNMSGTIRITNGQVEKLIYPEELPEYERNGWRHGRK